MNHFSLHPRLAADSHLITHLPLCELRLMDDARYPWLILIPRRPAISEVFELSEHDQQQMWREASQLGQALKQQYQGDKINIATLGNMVAQLHLHVILRHQDDPAWPGPVWGQGQAEIYDDARLEQISEELLALVDDLTLGD